ncbi:glycoside hydrolase family 3 N-terminal domain-containing protein [Zhouia sp. PK063]|uniref:glycoside hydrolase family 3 N-terminal domain-containing protein n=1 Tax=Zhouia sp. PK063 TaxID=3373602 RepID=UPI0037AF3F9B
MLLFIHCAVAQNLPIYKNPKYTVKERVDNLLSLMTLDEKIGQLSVPLGWKMYQKDNEHITVSKLLKKEISTRKIGMLWATLRADPWTKKTLLTGLNPEQSARATNAIQKYAIEHSRLGIPLLFAEECMHGHMAIGTTVFPTAIGQSSTWNPVLIQKMASTIADETRSEGAQIAYGPILDLAREPRWSRVEETFGEDPYLVAKMGEAVVKGFQGDTLASSRKVISTLKHFAAYGISEGGHNGGAVYIGERSLFQDYLYPFKKAIQQGAQSVMTAYSSVDGIPSTSNTYLLRNVLRDNWGFNGFVVSDLGSIEGLKGDHHVAATNVGAATLAINAGVDADLGSNGFNTALKEAIEKGKVSIETLNYAVRNVLTAKFVTGVFDHPYVDEKKASKIVHSSKNIAIAREVAQESVILLKNENRLLPLSKNIKKIAVIGPNANTMYNQLGDYTAPQPNNKIITVLNGIQNKLPNAKVTYVKGTPIRDTTTTNIKAAVEVAKNAEVAIVVLGGSSARDFKTKYIETGAATVSQKGEGIISDMESGEGFDRATLSLMGNQLRLLKAVVATGTPTVLVLIKGRPLLLNWPTKNVPAILDAWYPGEQGGNAIADVLFGDYNPAGRLPISVPKSVGQLPVFYDHLAPNRRSYVEEDGEPLFAFGYGLSYATFKYSNLKITVDEIGKKIITVALNIKNTSGIDGDEVVQLYVKDEASSVVTAVKQLKGFQRVFIKSGEEKRLVFKLPIEELSLYNTEMKRLVEPGFFNLMIGSASNNIRLQGEFEVKNEIIFK